MWPESVLKDMLLSLKSCVLTCVCFYPLYVRMFFAKNELLCGLVREMNMKIEHVNEHRMIVTSSKVFSMLPKMKILQL